MTPATLKTIKPNGIDYLVDSNEPQLRAMGTPKIHLATLTFQTGIAPQFIDLTDLVEQNLRKTGMREGSVLVYSRHTTAGILINENEPLLLNDMRRYIASLASADGNYDHNDFDVRTVNMCADECANGHAHCQHLTIGCSEHIPVTNGKLLLGQWQRIFLVELDHPRKRDVCLQFFGV